MSKPSRSGFTLIELMMVIVVIVILSGLLFVGSMSVLGSSREADTLTTLRKATQITKDRQTAYSEASRPGNFFSPWEFKKVYARFRQETGPGPMYTPEQTRIKNITDAIFQRIETVCGPHTAPGWDQKTAQTMLVIELERLFFPQTWAEADYMLALEGKPSISSDPASETENSEVLYWMLTGKSIVGAIQEDGDWIKKSMTADKDGDGLPELVDSWGGMIRFYRWPTRLITFTSSTGKKFRQLFFSEAILSGPDGSKDPRNPLNLAGGTLVPPEYYDPQLYHNFLIVSPGPDGRHGMRNPVNKTDFGYWGEVMPEDIIPEPPMATVILENPGHRDIFDDLTDKTSGDN